VTYMLEKPEPKKKPKKRDKGAPVTDPSELDPERAKQPRMIEDKPLVGSINVRQYEEITIAGKTYWKVSQKDNEYVLRSAISPHTPSHYAGARLGDDTGLGPQIAFVWPRGGMQVTWTNATAAGAGAVRQIAARTAVGIVETSRDAKGVPLAYRIGAAEWIRAADVRVFAPAPPPPLIKPGERWVDVDLDNQILVAFEGDVPVYATMVSTGGKDTPTETGVYRMWVKESEADMKGLNGEDPYSVATVPWTQFFSPEKGLALHTAYWHDQFGVRRSHGCVNLAPRDARWLYFWSDPQVPAGWTMAAGVVEAPGSIVRVRTKDEPAPPFRGYAKKVQETREAG
jgi:lipoprotein-anchoring transpeptidase ErfK/SrfK